METQADFKKIADLQRAWKPTSFHPRRLYSPRVLEKLFVQRLRWNVLVIDNEITQSNGAFNVERLSSLPSLYQVLSWPDCEFHGEIKVYPYYPKSLLFHSMQLEDFLTEFMYKVYKWDIDLVLLDVALTRDGTEGDIEREGFYLIEELQQQLFQLGWQNVPIVMFSKYEDIEFVIASINRGARWYCSKEYGEKGELSWVGKLHDIVKKVHTPLLWLGEYLHKYLPGCFGATQKTVKEHLEKSWKRLKEDREQKEGQSQEDLIELPNVSESEFELFDHFFEDEHSRNTFVEVVLETCRRRDNTYDMDKVLEYHYILRRLFSSFDRVVIQGREKGLSKTDIFFVIPYKEEREYSVQIVKMGPFDEIIREKLNFEEWINGMVDTFIGRIKGGPIRANRYAGIFYVAVGIKEDYTDGRRPISLRKLIEHFLDEKPFQGKEIKEEDVHILIKEIFNKALSPIYKGTQNQKQFWRLISAYIEDLPSILSGDLAWLLVEPEDKENGWWDGTKNGKPERIPQGVRHIKEIIDIEDYVYLPEFEIYEVDHPNRQFKVTNAPQCLPQEVQYRDTKFYKWALEQVKHNADLRVDVRVELDKFKALFTDPRISRGKRVSLLLRNPRRLWETERLKFLKESPELEFSSSCVKAMKALEEEIHQGIENKGDFCYALLEEFKKLVEDGILSFSKSLTTSIIHGDLNLENILVTLSGEADSQKLLGWFIDFSRSREGHTAHDFVKLETEIKTHLLAKYLARLISKMQLKGCPQEDAVKQCFLWYLAFERDNKVDNECASSEWTHKFFSKEWDYVQKLANLILLIREIAASYGLREEYNWALFFYSFSALKFSNLDKPEACAPIPKCLAYIAASRALQKLKGSDLLFKQQEFFLPVVKREACSSQIKEALEIYAKDVTEEGWIIEFLRSVKEKGLSPEETVALTRAIAESGRIIDWEEECKECITIDIPSTGGTGSKVPLIVPPIVFATAREFGKKLFIPKISSRGVPAGTIDILESVGYIADLPLDNYKQNVKRIGLSNICQTEEIAPLDKWLMKLRKKMRTMRQAHLTVSSILGKKLATGCRNLLIEIKDGSESKMRFPNGENNAERGAELFLKVAQDLDMKVACAITDGSGPQGHCIGNLLALYEAVSFLEGCSENNRIAPPERLGFSIEKELEDLYIEIAKRALKSVGIEIEEDWIKENIINSRKALEVFKNMLSAHGVAWKDVERSFKALQQRRENSRVEQVKSQKEGWVHSIDVNLVDTAAKLLIAPQGEIVHYDAGIVLLKQIGDKVRTNDILAEIYYAQEWQVDRVKELLLEAYDKGIKPNQIEKEEHKNYLKRVMQWDI